MNLPLEIAWRYLRRPTDKLVSTAGLVSILGLVIGVIALVISMALMTGYRDDLQKKLLGGNAELFVYALGDSIESPQVTLQRIRAIEGVADASPVLLQQGLVSSERHTTGQQITIKGIQPERGRSSRVLQKVVGPAFSFRTSEGLTGVALGKHLARKLGVEAGDAVTLTVATPAGESFTPASESYVVARIFDTGFFEFDAHWSFLDLRDAQTLFELPGSVNLIEVKLAPGGNVEQIKKQVAARTGNRYALSDWREMNRQLFSMLRIQQLILFIVIGLIVCVSTFNIVSTLIMTVHEKRREIGILASMGAEQKLLRRVFISLGTLVGVIGTGLGLMIGVTASYVITRFELVSFGPEIAEVYFVSSIPFVTRWQDLTTIALFTVAVSCLSTVIPSARAARLNPADALRHE